MWSGVVRCGAVRCGVGWCRVWQPAPHTPNLEQDSSVPDSDEPGLRIRNESHRERLLTSGHQIAELLQTRLDVGPRICDNPQCANTSTQARRSQKCSRCLRARYCSKQCEFVVLDFEQGLNAFETPLMLLSGASPWHAAPSLNRSNPGVCNAQIHMRGQIPVRISPWRQTQV